MNRGLPQAGQTEKPHPAGSHTVSNLLMSSIFTSTSCKEAPLIKKKKNPGTNGCILAGWALEGETPHILSNCTTEISPTFLHSKIHYKMRLKKKKINPPKIY